MKSERAIIRDTYGHKHYEIIELGNEIFVYDCLPILMEK